MKNAATESPVMSRSFGPQNPFWIPARLSRESVTPIMMQAISPKNMDDANMTRYTPSAPHVARHPAFV